MDERDEWSQTIQDEEATQHQEEIRLEKERRQQRTLRMIIAALGVAVLVLIIFAGIQSYRYTSLEAQAAELQKTYQSVKNEDDWLEHEEYEYDQMKAAYDDLMASAPVKMKAIREAYDEKEWSQVVTLAKEFEEDFPEDYELTEAKQLQQQAQANLDAGKK